MSQCQMIEERLTDTLLDQEPEESVPHVLGMLDWTSLVYEWFRREQGASGDSISAVKNVEKRAKNRSLEGRPNGLLRQQGWDEWKMTAVESSEKSEMIQMGGGSLIPKVMERRTNATEHLLSIKN